MGNDTAILICDGELEIVKITEDLYDGAAELLKNYHLKYENQCIATNIMGSQQAINEMEIMLREILKDGVSFAAKHRKTNKLVAMCCNKIFNPTAGVTLDYIYEKFSSPVMACIGQAIERMESSYDLYKEWQIQCIVEIVFLTTNPDFAGKGIAAKLSQHAINYVKNLKNGTLPVNEALPIHIRDMKPQAICSVFSSFFSQRVGEKLGFETLHKIANTDFVFDGKSFAEKIDPIHQFTTFAAMRL